MIQKFAHFLPFHHAVCILSIPRRTGEESVARFDPKSADAALTSASPGKIHSLAKKTTRKSGLIVTLMGSSFQRIGSIFPHSGYTTGFRCCR